METTRSSAYRLARYTILPEVCRRAEELGDDPFLLREFARPIIESHIPPEYRNIFIPFAQSEGRERFIQIVKWYVSFLAKKQGLFENLGQGQFRNKTEEDIEDEAITESALEEGDEEVGEFDGWIYAFSFPSITKEGNEAFPIKIGKTVGDVAARVIDQAKGSAMFEYPVVLAKWQVKRVGPTELAIHNILKARNQWIENAPGREWFKTYIHDIDAIVSFITR